MNKLFEDLDAISIALVVSSPRKSCKTISANKKNKSYVLMYYYVYVVYRYCCNSGIQNCLKVLCKS